jgi:uncharacterized protein
MRSISTTGAATSQYHNAVACGFSSTNSVSSDQQVTTSKFPVAKPCLSLLLIIGLVSIAFGQSNFKTETSKWRQERETDLKAEDGWLSVAGLYWLNEGLTTIGTDKSRVDIVLPPQSAPGRVGSLELKDGVVTFQGSDGVSVRVDDKPVTEYVMTFETEKPPKQFKIGSLSLGVIKRSERYALRVRDKNSPARLQFKGLDWFPANASYRVVATFTPYEKPTEMTIMNVLGNEIKMKTPGTLSFMLKGQKFELRPVIEDDKKLFIIFRDLTAGKTTYAAGRYLYAALPKDGKVVLDFNRSENPPCAFTKFATCPLPPRQNFMKIAILAGEMKYH